MIGGMKVALIVALVSSITTGELKDKLEFITFVVFLVSLIIHYIVLCCMIRKTVKTLSLSYPINLNYNYFHSFNNTKTLTKNDLK
jgi:hypothetical protein